MAGERANERHAARQEPAFTEWFELGEGEALRMLYVRYSRRLRAYCMRRLDNSTDAEDAVQETFLKVQQGLHRFDRDAPFWPWLVTIAARVCTDIHRLHERAAERDLGPDPIVDPEEHAALRAKVSIVDDALRSMPDRYRTSLYLRHFEGSSYEEIAHNQGTSIASVRSTLMRGRRQLGLRIEELARAERQWPLPSTVSVLARRVRDRVRSWCRDACRMLQGAVGVIDSAATFNAFMASAPSAMAAVGALALLVTGGSATGPQTADVLRADPAAAVAVGSSSSSSPLVTVGDRRAGLAVDAASPPPPLITVETPSPSLAPDGAVPQARAAANDDGALVVDIRVLTVTSRTWTGCVDGIVMPTACTIVRAGWGTVGGRMPETPGEVDVHDGPSR